MKKEKQEAGQRKFWWINIIAVIATIILTSMSFSKEIEVGSMTFNLGETLVLPLLIGIILGLVIKGKLIHSAKAEEFNLVVFFGDILFISKPGPLFLFPGLFSVKTLPKQTQMEQYPDDTDKIFWGPDEEMPKEGQTRAVRISTGSKDTVGIKETNLEKDPLHQKRMVLGTTWQIGYVIEDPILFYINVGDLKIAKERMRDASEGKFVKEFALRTTAQILRDQQKINELLEGDLLDLINDKFNPEGLEKGPGAWGIKITKVQIINLNLSKDLSTEMRNATQALVKKEKTITDAEATRKETELKGEGLAKAEKLMLLARAEGLKKMADDLGVTEGELLLKLEMATTALKNSEYNLVTASGLSDLFAIAPGIKNILEEGGKPKNK